MPPLLIKLLNHSHLLMWNERAKNNIHTRCGLQIVLLNIIESRVVLELYHNCGQSRWGKKLRDKIYNNKIKNVHLSHKKKVSDCFLSQTLNCKSEHIPWIYLLIVNQSIIIARRHFFELCVRDFIHRYAIIIKLMIDLYTFRMWRRMDYMGCRVGILR